MALITVQDLIVLNEPKYRVYMLVNKVTGKKYIGQTSQSIRERFRHHCKSRAETGSNIGDAINKYGTESFYAITLASCDNYKDALSLENLYIEQYNTLAPHGYNLSINGITIDSVKQKLSDSKIGLQIKAEVKPMKTLRKTATKRGLDKVKSVRGIHLITGEIIKLPSMSADSRFDPRLISAVCKGKRRHHRGYRWEIY